MKDSSRNFACAGAAVVVVLCLGIGLRLSNLGNVPSRSPDEKTYTRQANRILAEGSSGARALVEEYRRDPELRWYPIPSRAGYLWLLTATMKATGIRDASAGAYLSCAASIGSLLLLAAIGTRYFPPWAALSALLFFAVSPAELSLARRTWGDAPLGFLALVMILSAAEITRNSRSRFAYVVLVAAGALAITVKETGPIIFGLCLIWVSWVLFIEKKAWREGLALILLGGAGTAAAVSWLAVSAGGSAILLEIVLSLLKANAENVYSLEYQTGPWYSVLQGFFIVGPLAALSSVAGLASVPVSRFTNRPLRGAADRTDQRAIAGIAFVLVSFLALPMILPHWANLRYFSVIFGPLYLLAGLGLWYAFRELARRFPASRPRVFVAIAGFVVLIGAAVDYQFFQSVIVRQALPDLSIKMLLEARRQVQPPAVNGNPVRESSAGDGPPVPGDRFEGGPSPENYLNLSLRYHQEGRYQDSIAACREALKLRPGYAEAFNNIAAAYQSLGLWDEAIEAAERALQLKPDFPLARNNLQYSLGQQQLKQGKGAAIQ